MEDKEWYESWFDSPYYHILYQDRDGQEARNFIERLTARLHLGPQHHVLDLACGKGRHSIHLNSLGIRVTGLDLSEQSIKQASQYETDTLSFKVSDMRRIRFEGEFSHVFNLFTSFGYFSDPQDNQLVFNAVNKSLMSNGIFVLDFLNTERLKNTLPEREVKHVGGIDFHIFKHIKHNYIEKAIRFTDKTGKTQRFTERVTAFSFDQLSTLFRSSGFDIYDIFGDYALSPFHKHDSERLVIAGKKRTPV